MSLSRFFGRAAAPAAALPRHIWSVPAYLPYLQPELTPEAVRQAEEHLGVKLPEAYLALLREQNGGYVRKCLPDSVHSMIWGIGPHFPNITQYREQLDPEAAEETGDWAPKKPKLLVPFDGDGHWYLCLDYRKGREPSVSLIDIEQEEDTRVAPSFGAFLGLLRVEEDDAPLIGVGPDLTLDEVATRLAQSIGTAFEPMDSEEFPMVKCQPPGADKGALLWMASNLVPRAFARPGERRHDELATALPGEAMSWPEYDGASVLIWCSSGLKTALPAWCQQAGLPVVPRPSFL